MSVAQYVRLRKLTQVDSLLPHTIRPVTNISLLYDFSSLQNFSRAFRHQYRVSPLLYRETDTREMQYGTTCIDNYPQQNTDVKYINIRYVYTKDAYSIYFINSYDR